MISCNREPTIINCEGILDELDRQAETDSLFLNYVAANTQAIIDLRDFDQATVGNIEYLIDCYLRTERKLDSLSKTLKKQAEYTNTVLINLVARQIATEKTLKEFAGELDRTFQVVESTMNYNFSSMKNWADSITYTISTSANMPCSVDSLFLQIQNIYDNYIIKGDGLSPAARDSILNILTPIIK